MKRVRDFHSQSWNNPFFAKERIARRWHVLVASTGLVFAGTVAAGVVYTPVFKIDEIKVYGNGGISVQAVTDAAERAIDGLNGLLMPNDFIWAADTDGIRHKLAESFPEARDFRVTRKFKRIEIAVEERKATFRLLGEGNSYLLDQDGKGMRAAGQGEGEDLIAIRGAGMGFGEGKEILSGGWPLKIQNIHKYFATLTGVRDQLIEVDAASGAVNVITPEGWYAVIDPDGGLEAQFRSLAVTVIGKLNLDQRKNLLYADPRLVDKVYYKMK